MARGGQEVARTLGGARVAQGRGYGQHKDAGPWLKVLNKAGRPADVKSRLERTLEQMFSLVTQDWPI